MKTTKKPQIDDLVHVIFWDHCENFNDAMQFEVVGKVTGITSKAYVIHTWMYHNEVQKATDSNSDDNENCFCIVKKAIDSIRVLK